MLYSEYREQARYYRDYDRKAAENKKHQTAIMTDRRYCAWLGRGALVLSIWMTNPPLPRSATGKLRMASKLIDVSHASRLNLSPRRYPHPNCHLIAVHRTISNGMKYDSYLSTGVIPADLSRISCRPLVSYLDADIRLVPLPTQTSSMYGEKESPL